MTAAHTDVAIIGAGPAGMSAAIAACEHGLSVTVLDEQAAAGGQIWRGVLAAPKERMRILGEDYAAGAQVAQAFGTCGARHLRGAAVWQVTRERLISYLHDGAHHELQAGKVIVCTGAMERPFPIPGWTLPGVMTAGAGQILLKSAGLAPQVPVVLAGCGPLLLLLAAQYLRAGVHIAAVVDTTGPADWRRALPLLPQALRDWRLLAKGRGLLRELRASGTAIYTGATALAIEGEHQAAAIRFDTPQGPRHVEAGLVLLHHGIIPNTQLTRSLQAEHDWDETQLCWHPRASAQGALADMEGFYVAGDSARIMGAAASAVSGRICGLAAAGAPTESAQLQLAKLCAARPFLDRLYRPQDALRIPQGDTIVCRCEEITAREIRGHVANGCAGPNQLKSFTRCGMGPCQGRQCGITVSELIAQERSLSPAVIGYQRVRAPIKPVSVGELAGL